MRRKTALPELLAPAGDFEALIAAISAGADAVYIGGKSFGARAYAKNFELDELSRAVEYAHIHGRKIYVTVNTLVYDRELSGLSDYAKSLYEMGVDAIICADLGAIKEIRRRAPKLEIHASTQMSVHNSLGAQMAAELGAKRVVAARELSLENIKAVVENPPIEVEIFLHGALCVCHSGQCLMSALVGGRSGNRGECAQPCRLPYNSSYPISLSDLSLANHIPEIIESGVASLKIEGRMKSAQYVYTVTKIYRRLLDEHRSANVKELRELDEIFSRGGFTDGYFTDRKFDKMTGVRSDSQKQRTREIEEMKFPLQRVRAVAKVVMKLGEKSEMTLTANGKSVTVYGESPRPAINSPLEENGVKERLSKMGATYFILEKEDIDLILDAKINLSPSEINALRRDAAEKLSSTAREPINTQGYTPCNGISAQKRLRTAQFLCSESFLELKSKYPEALESFDITFVPLDVPDAIKASNGVSLPPVIFDSELECVREHLALAKENGVQYALISNLSQIPIVKEISLIPIGDFRLNITNSLTKAVYKALGVLDSVLSPELTLPMARDIGGGEVVCGRIPLMITERCFIKENFGCQRCKSASLEDRYSQKFPIIREFGHRNLILNSHITYMGDAKEELAANKILHEHFIFSDKTAEEIKYISDSYFSGKSIKGAVRRIGVRKARN